MRPGSPLQPETPGNGYVYGVFGDRGTGKSTLARNLQLNGIGKGSLAIYATPNGAATDPYPGPDWSPHDRETPLPYAVAMRGEDIDDVCQFAIDCSQKFSVRLLIDEAHETYPEHFPDGPRSELFHRGRHYGIGLGIISQWPSMVSKRIFRAAREVYWFRLHASEDLWWIRKRWGPTAARELANLPDFRHVRIEGDRLPESWRDVDALRPRRGGAIPETPDPQLPLQTQETPPDSQDLPPRHLRSVK